MGGVEQYIREDREAMGVVNKLIQQHARAAPGRSPIRMRFEPRWRGAGLDEALREDPPEDDSEEARAAAGHAHLANLTTILVWYHLELFNVKVSRVASICAHELLVPPALQLGMADATLLLLRKHFKVSATDNLANLDFDIHTRLARMYCTARAQLGCCGPVEAALIEATNHLDALAEHVRNLAPSRGTLLAEAKAKREQQAAAAAAEEGGAPPSSHAPHEEEEEGAADASGAAAAEEEGGRTQGERPPPKPRTMAQHWLEVARSFPRAPMLRVLMVMLRIGTRSADNPNVRLGRVALNAAFAAAMAKRRDAGARALALKILPSLRRKEFDAAAAAAKEEEETTNTDAPAPPSHETATADEPAPPQQPPPPSPPSSPAPPAPPLPTSVPPHLLLGRLAAAAALLLAAPCCLLTPPSCPLSPPLHAALRTSR